MDEFKLTQINMVMLGVKDVERSLTFYRDRLGLHVRNQISGFVFFDAGAITLVLSAPLANKREPKGEAVEIVFAVRHVKPAFEALRERGVVFLNEPRNVNGPFWAANFHDPDHHLLSIFGNE
jgi:catechol 2,3-dioxygenase-like lactoylglutathione lyase family enzyme